MVRRVSTKSDSRSPGPFVLLGVGSNLGDRIDNLRNGVTGLVESGVVSEVRASAVYQSAPVDCGGGIFYNAVISARSSVTPSGLLTVIKRLESDAGRTGSSGDARPLDIDIIYYGDIVLQGPDLEIPHPTRFSRPFVLAPLMDVCEESKDPTTGRAIRLEAFERLVPETHEVRLVMGPEWLDGPAD